MDTALYETTKLAKIILSLDVQQGIQMFVASLANQPEQKYDTQIIWLLDQKIGGIGGYCMPPNPIYNPFPGGNNRELFRPLQYARSDIDICDIRMHARYVVQSSGLHLEAVCKLFLKSTKYLGPVRFNRITLGRAVHIIEQTKLLNEKVIDGLYCFVVIYNKSKHEINNDDNRTRMFTPEDGITAYFGARILGQELLKYINFEKAFDTYEICNKM